MQKNCVLTVIFMVIIVLDFLLGLTCLGVGIWMHASADVYAYMTVFVQSKNDQILIAAAGLLLATGLILALLTALAALGVFLKDARFLQIFLALIGIVVVLGLICGFMVVGFNWDIHRKVSRGMNEQLQEGYTWDSRIGKAWNRVQVKKRCCGVDGPWDYLNTAWFASSNTDLVTKTSFVPDSCCSLNFNQDRELPWVDPQNPQPRDKRRCNEDAEGNKSTSANLNGSGCFSMLFTRNPDNWHDMDILTIIELLEGLGLAAGFFQIVVVVLTLIYMQILRSNSEAGKNLVGRY